MIPRMVIAFTVAMMVMGAGPVRAQGFNPFGQGAAPAAFPPVNGSSASMGAFPSQGAAPIGGMGARPAAGPSEDCMKRFVPLREETERRGKAWQTLASGSNHPTAEQGCSAYRGLAESMHKMLKFIDANGARCQIPGQVGAQIKDQYAKLEEMRRKVCEIAQQQQRGREPTLSDLLSSSAAPEAGDVKKGATFDTLNGNVLTRSYTR
ncbi:MAG: hypothetical protein FWD68_10630 [Alphaproteobacteria bacterium]|nr:hypothetical protein [Alphaproteobacteria bacterium]